MESKCEFENYRYVLQGTYTVIEPLTSNVNMLSRIIPFPTSGTNARRSDLGGGYPGSGSASSTPEVPQAVLPFHRKLYVQYSYIADLCLTWHYFADTGYSFPHINSCRCLPRYCPSHRYRSRFSPIKRACQGTRRIVFDRRRAEAHRNTCRA